MPCAPTLLPLECCEGTCGAGIRRVRPDAPPFTSLGLLHRAPAPGPVPPSLAIQGGVEGPRRPHPSPGREARREGEEKAPLPFKGCREECWIYVSKVRVSYSAYVSNSSHVGCVLILHMYGIAHVRRVSYFAYVSNSSRNACVLLCICI